MVLAFITDPRIVKKILDHLRLPSTNPPRAPARLSRQQVEMFADPPMQDDNNTPSAPHPRASRSPP